MKKNSHNIFLSSASAIHDKLVNSKKQKWTEKNCIKADSSGSSIVITIFLKKIFFAENERKKKYFISYNVGFHIFFMVIHRLTISCLA